MMISLETFRDLFKYNYWARDRQLEACAQLTRAQFRHPLVGSFSSLGDTLAHMLAAEWVWLERLQGRSPEALPTFKELATLEELGQRWRSIESNFIGHLSTIVDEQISSTITYTNFRGQTCTYPVWMILLHVINHQSYHRGQVTTILRQLGAKAAAVDLLLADDCGLFRRLPTCPDTDKVPSSTRD